VIAAKAAAGMYDAVGTYFWELMLTPAALCWCCIGRGTGDMLVLGGMGAETCRGLGAVGRFMPGMLGSGTGVVDTNLGAGHGAEAGWHSWGGGETVADGAVDGVPTVFASWPSVAAFCVG
jgi:hypothetical protein